MKVAIAGLGSIGQRHARNLRRLLGARLELLAYRTRGFPHVITDQMTIAEGQTVETAYGVRVFDNLDALLAEQPVALLVCNPTSLHLPTALAAARAGCHLLIEKPLSDSYDGVDDLIALIEQRGLVAAVGYQMRCHPALIRLRTLISQGAVGRVVSVRAEMGEYLPDAHPYEDYRQSYAARADLGGGVIRCFIHEFDYVQWLFGPARHVITVGGRLGDLEIDVEDTATTDMQCCVNGHPVSVQVHQSFVQRARSRTCVVTGDAGAIHVDLNAPTLTWTDAAGRVVEQSGFAGFARNHLFVSELTRFLATIAGDGPPPASVHEAALSLRVALAARASLASGQRVECP